LSGDSSVLILAENTSNVHIANSISAVERLFLFLKTNPTKEFNPNLLITIGGSVVSKQVKLYFREHKPKNHWHISDELEIVDTFNSLTQSINASPKEVLPSLLQIKSSSESEFQSSFLNINRKLEQVQSDYIESIEFSDLLVYKSIIEELSENVSLHLGNSTAIRYSQLFETKEKFQYYSNRGVSGIDGSLSTAAGFAKESKNLTLAIVGDISFLYDSNALWIRSLSKKLRIIVVNNGGGDIFRWINNSGKSDLDNFIETPQNVNIELLTEAFGLEYLHADSIDTFKKNLKKIFEPSEKAIVLEVKTSGKPNSDILKRLYISFKEYKYE
jgi:2-succinyl-5-enolpyruvyl-6-hydroxy-3-cyclohexene-1-carboxylate synthase